MGARPLPCAIAVMTLLMGVKTAGLVSALSVSNTAHASTPAAVEAKPASPKGCAAAEAPTPAPVTLPADPPISDAERATLSALRARHVELDTRAARLDEREALLTAAERRLTDRLKQMTALQTKLEQLEKDRQDRQEINWRGLVKTYEDMRPKDAATIFNDLDNGVLIPVLDRMKDAKAAPILAAMTPERARAVTAQLAQVRLQANAAPKLDGTEGQKP